MDNPMTAAAADAVQLDVLTVDNDNKTCLFLRLQGSTGKQQNGKVKLYKFLIPKFRRAHTHTTDRIRNLENQFTSCLISYFGSTHSQQLNLVPKLNLLQ